MSSSFLADFFVSMFFFFPLTKNPLREIKRIMHYLDLSVSEDVIERIVQLTSFQVMKDNPMANYSFIPKPVFDQSISAFMRKGSYKTILDYISLCSRGVMIHLAHDIR